MLPANFKKHMKVIPDPKVGDERRLELSEDQIRKGTHLPRGVMFEDMDASMVEFFEYKLSITLNWEVLPVILLTIQRWSEFSQTWEFSDEFKNIKIPFVTIVRQPDPQQGENQGGYWNIPGDRVWSVHKVPTWNGNRVGMSIYKIPQPSPVDLVYDVRVFTSKMRDLNKVATVIHKEFSDRQSYIWPNHHPLPLHLEDVSDESTVDDFENRRFYVQDYNFVLNGFILDEEDFKIEPAIDRAVFNVSIEEQQLAPVFKLNRVDGDDQVVNFNVIIKPYGPNHFETTMEYDVDFRSLTIVENTSFVDYEVNGVSVVLPFTINRGDKLGVRAQRNPIKMSRFIIRGYLL